MNQLPIATMTRMQRLELSPMAMLTHNRDIHMRCDDSVMRIAAGGEQFFRRSRGYAPEPIALSTDLPVPVACLWWSSQKHLLPGQGPPGLRQLIISAI